MYLNSFVGNMCSTLMSSILVSGGIRTHVLAIADDNMYVYSCVECVHQ